MGWGSEGSRVAEEDGGCGVAPNRRLWLTLGSCLIFPTKVGAPLGLTD